MSAYFTYCGNGKEGEMNRGNGQTVSDESQICAWSELRLCGVCGVFCVSSKNKTFYDIIRVSYLRIRGAFFSFANE